MERGLEGATDILKKMVHKRYGFDPASFMPVIDGLGKKGIKHEADELAERMLEMASHSNVTNKVYRSRRELYHEKPGKYGRNDWQAILHRYGYGKTFSSLFSFFPVTLLLISPDSIRV